MSIKEKILQELEQLPDSSLQEVLNLISKLKDDLEEKQTSTISSDQVWQAYLKSKKEREEVYRRLADS